MFISSGSLVFYKGQWVEKDGKRVVMQDGETGVEYEFESVVHSSAKDLLPILSKQIKSELNIDYPIFVDQRTLDVETVGIKGYSERFDKLVEKV